jgi:hypothetical protein
VKHRFSASPGVIFWCGDRSHARCCGQNHCWDRLLTVINGQFHQSQSGVQRQHPAFALAQGENPAGLVGQRAQRLRFFFDHIFVASLSAGEIPVRLP